MENRRLINVLQCGIEAMRKTAERVGPMHAYWDVIADAEMLLNDALEEANPSALDRVAKTWSQCEALLVVGGAAWTCTHIEGMGHTGNHENEIAQLSWSGPRDVSYSGDVEVSVDSLPAKGTVAS